MKVRLKVSVRVRVRVRVRVGLEEGDHALLAEVQRLADPLDALCELVRQPRLIRVGVRVRLGVGLGLPSTAH